MPLRVYDFECPHGHLNEKFVEAGTEAVPCPSCSQQATRVISAPRFHLDSSFPGYADKWARDHEKAAKTNTSMPDEANYKPTYRHL